MNKPAITWEHIFSQMDDLQVFYFYRLYIKDITTPFHKPKLIAELKKFTQKHADVMVSLLDEEDMSFITFIMLFRSAEFSVMHQFYNALGFTSLTMQKKLMNLQERMIIFFHDGTLLINPLLLKRIEHYADISTLFIRKNGSAACRRKMHGSKHGSFWLTLDACIGLFSLLEQNPQTSADPGTMYIEAFQEKFLLSPSAWKKAAGDFILRMLGSLSLNTHPFSAVQKRHIDLLMQLSEPVCYGLLVLCGILPEQKTADADKLSAFISFTAAASQLLLKKRELILLFSLLSRGTDLTYADCTLITERLIELNFLTAEDEDGGLFAANSTFASQLLFESAKEHADPNNRNGAGELSGTVRKGGIQDAEPAAILSNDFTLHIPKEIPCSQWYAVYSFAVYQKSDQLASFHITKESVLHAVDQGLSADYILQFMESLTGKVPESVAVSIKQWEKDFLEIQLFRGTVLKAEGRKKYIIDHHPEIQKYILQKLADGVYLINQQSEDQLRDILRKSGIDFLPSTRFTGNRSSSSEESGGGTAGDLGALLKSLNNLPIREIKDSVFSHQHIRETEKQDFTYVPLNRESARTYYNEYQQEIDEHYSGDEHDELTERLQNRILLSFRQLHSCSHVRTRFEANGFNYQSKIQLIKQVITNSGELLEIRMRPGAETGASSPLPAQPEDAADAAFLFRPLRLEKGDADNPADIVSGYVLPEGNTAELSVSKIFRIIRPELSDLK